MSQPSIAEELRKIILQETGCNLANDQPLSDLLNSITFIKVMVECEKVFSIQFADAELDNKKYATFDQLVEFVATKVGDA